MNFWQKLFDEDKVVGMSPMDGVTDAPMRYMSAKYGRPKVIFTEFISVDGLRYAKDPQAVSRLMRAFVRARDLGPLETRPYEVAQVFGHTPEYFYTAGVIVASLGYDGMDINMGCPAKSVEEHGSGAGLIRTPELAKEIVRHAKRGVSEVKEGKVKIEELEVSEAVKDWVKSRMPKEPKGEGVIPVSVKTRIGVDRDVAEWWMGELMEVTPAVISLHGRTLKQMYQGLADWEAIGRAAQVVHDRGGHILGNGDIASMQDARDKIARYDLDGALIGRAAEGNPAVFLESSQSSNSQIFTNGEPSWEQRKAWMLEHVEIYEKMFKPEGEINTPNWFMPIRKHLAWYCKGREGASEMRSSLVRCSSLEDVARILS